MRLTLLTLLATAACVVTEERPPQLASAPITVVTPLPGPRVAAPDGVQLSVTDVTGLDPAVLGSFYAGARESLGHCHQHGGGTVYVRVVRRGTSLHMHIEPGDTLNPTAHRCVLEALSTLDVPDTGGNVGGWAIPPSGFTSLITVAW